MISTSTGWHVVAGGHGSFDWLHGVGLAGQGDNTREMLDFIAYATTLDASEPLAATPRCFSRYMRWSATASKASASFPSVG